MKTRFSTYLFIVCLLTSCGGKLQPEQQPEVISFRTGVTQTKGSIVTSSLGDGASWGVFGYLYPTKSDGTPDTSAGTSTWETKHAQSKPSVFHRQEVRFNNGQNTYDNLKYWSNNTSDKYTFFAYYPYTMPDGGPDMKFSGQDAMDAPVATFTLPWNTTSKGTNWVTYSYASGDKSKMVDLLTAKTYDVTQSDGAVPIQFEHALYAIDFAVNNYNSSKQDGSNDITITSIIFKGRFTKTMTFPLDGNDYSLNAASTSGDFMAEFSIFSGSVVFPADTQLQYIGENDTDRYLFFIPQDVPNYKEDTNTYDRNNDYAGFQVEITYKKGTGRETTTKLNVPKNIYYAGIKYTFTLDFLGEQVVIKTLANGEWIDNDGNTNTEFN